jgi:hypothetical protein
MPEIRYVCLSDTHFGAESSLLTNLKIACSDPDPTQPSPVMQQLVACLRDLLAKTESNDVTLILNGDALEMALTTDNQADMVFERFVELIMPPGNEFFKRIIFIPGNHDHHLWELARETQYVNYIRGIKPGENLPPPWHTTNMFVANAPNSVVSYSLTNLVQRYPHLEKFQITTAYPNFGLFSEKDQKCVVFHHGHFIESLYELMTTLTNMIFPERQRPTHMWDIEGENFAWIDFFWSTMGRSGNVGEAVELIYDKLQDPKQFKQLLYNLADSLVKQYGSSGLEGKVEVQCLEWIISAAVDKAQGTEKTITDRLLSEDAEKGLWAYMGGPLADQIVIERGKMPQDVTFIFGHTHKPFQEDMNFRGYPRWVKVYNSGGWVVESVDPQPLHGGSVILVDEELNAVSLRMYNEDANPANYSVKVEEASHPGEPVSPFCTRIAGLVNPSTAPWKAFSDAVARAVHVRAQNLRAKINEQGPSPTI